MTSLVISILVKPEGITSLRPREWDLLVRQARAANLLARLHVLLEQQNLVHKVPDRPLRHLTSARLLADKQSRDIRWEVHCIRRALSSTQTPVILLKGAAYVMADLPPARGRIFSDVDIMVPKDTLQAVEKALMMRGWHTTHHDAYDQRYYRQWMHELPPMQHIKRQTMLDVHHTILPESSRLKPDPTKLLESAVQLNDGEDIKVLGPADMVLHSATHLFHDGELQQGLRDLMDLNDLLRHFGRDDNFWAALVQRSREMDLARPLYYALRYTSRMLDTPIPEDIKREILPSRPSGPIPRIMDALFARGIAPHHSSCALPFSGPARWLLYVRSHYLRMPLHLLLPHLLRKAIRSQ